MLIAEIKIIFIIKLISGPMRVSERARNGPAQAVLDQVRWKAIDNKEKNI